jgi:hypothetical protein
VDQTEGLTPGDDDGAALHHALTERFRSAVDQIVGPSGWNMDHEMGW